MAKGGKMDLILWRHAEAEPGRDGLPDLERALTPKGLKQAKRMGQWLDSQLPESCRILASPAVRTVQTAEGLGRKYKTNAELAPGAAAAAILQAANWPAAKETVVIVGHQPTLGLVAALLLTGEPLDWEMKKAAAWWFVQREPDDPSSLYLKAVMSADLVVK
jgi:phosphohistidine phosphatase